MGFNGELRRLASRATESWVAKCREMIFFRLGDGLVNTPSKLGNYLCDAALPIPNQILEPMQLFTAIYSYL